jgi:amino acid transporter
MLGGGPTGQRLGFHYWNHPGAVNASLVPGAGGQFTAFLQVLVLSGFSFYFGPELVVFTSGEMQNPRKNLPIAARHFFYRLVFFYVLGALAIGVICSSKAKGLVSGAGDANASPWVIGIRNAGINVLPDIVNAGILISGWSAGNSYLYMSSRSLYSLAIAGNAPRIFARCNRYGLPFYAVIASSLFALLAYLNVGSQAGVVFNWFISLTNTAGYTSWLMCSIVLLRFRKACNAQGISTPYRSWVQPWASYVCIGSFVFLLLANGFNVFYPGQWTVSGFLVTYLGIPIFLILWAGHKVIAAKKEPVLIKPEDVDLSSNLREIEAATEMWNDMDLANKEAEPKRKQWWKKISMIWE